MRRAGSWLIVLAAALLLARLGPFGTFEDLPWPQRYAYWIGLTLLLWLQIEAALLLLRHAGWAARLGWARRAALAALAGSVPGAFEVAWAESLLRVERDLGALDILFIYGDVALIGLGLALLVETVRRAGAPVVAAATEKPVPAGSGAERLLAALPPEKRGAIAALAAEDHYLRVYTDRGEALVLMRFGDALAEVAGLEGLRVHRSWWVARSAVTGVEREGERLTLLLAGGVRVPVSRTYALAVREAGLAS